MFIVNRIKEFDEPPITKNGTKEKEGQNLTKEEQTEADLETKLIKEVLKFSMPLG